MFRYVSLFSGVGGFDTAINLEGGQCVLASEIDKWANKAYELLYGMETHGDVTLIEEVPDHELLVAGFPCQSFSITGKRAGFEDTRGTMFFEVARIAKMKRPKAILLENVDGLVSHDKGRTLEVILSTLKDLGYYVKYKVLNSKNFGVPQNRPRVFIVATLEDGFEFPQGTAPSVRLKDILESSVDEKYFYKEGTTYSLKDEIEQVTVPKINVIGHVDIKGYDLLKRIYDIEGISPTLNTMRGGNRQPKIIENGRVRKLTPLECFRLQGFEDSVFHTLRAAGISNSQMYSLAGNAVSVPVIQSIMRNLKPFVI